MASLTAEYALRAVVCLAFEPHVPHTNLQISQATKIPAPYLCKILRMLALAGIVTGNRGLNGGFVLQRDPGKLTLLEIIRVADPSRRIRTCPLHIHGVGLCELHRKLDAAEAASDCILSEATVADVLASPEVQPLRPTLTRRVRTARERGH